MNWIGVPALVLASSLAAGCAHVLSDEVLERVNEEIAFAAFREHAGELAGEVVLLGGVIVKAQNRSGGTELEIYETELSGRGKPKRLDRSQGRFLALYKGYLDPEIYRGGRRVTLAGRVQGEVARKLGEIEYRYPCVEILEIYLWPLEEYVLVDPYPPPGWYWHYRYWYPWYGPCYARVRTVDS